MTTVSKLGTFLHLYLHAAGIMVSESASLNELLSAAELPTEEEFGQMEPKVVRQISNSLNKLYQDYIRLELERRKAAAFPQASSEYKKAQAAIIIQESRIKNEKDKLKGLETIPIAPLSVHYSRPSKKHFKVSITDEPATKEEEDGLLEALRAMEPFKDDNDDSTDDDPGTVLRKLPNERKPTNDLKNVSRKETEEEEELAAAPRNIAPSETWEADQLAEVNITIEEPTDDELADLKAELAEIEDLDLAEIKWVQDVTEESLKELGEEKLEEIDNNILIDSRCTNLKEFELIVDENGEFKTNGKSPPSGREYSLKKIPMPNDVEILRLYVGSKHFCKGAIQFGDSCNNKGIRICHCVRGEDCATKVWGAHLICGHHFNALRGLYSNVKTEEKARQVAKYLGSNTKTGKPVSFKKN